MSKINNTPLPHEKSGCARCSVSKVLLVATMLTGISACQSGGSGSLLPDITSIGGGDEISFRNPPELHEWLVPQNGLVVCESEQIAMTMALTGFFLDTCQTISRPDQYQVTALDLRELEDGNMTWMVEVASSDGTAWVPLPWHDWV